MLRFGAVVVGFVLACGPGKPPDKPARPMSIVTSWVVLEACADSAKLNTKQATKEIEELIGPCSTVPGGAAHFSATLLPGGAVQLGAPTGDRSGGVVPTCILQTQKQLRHRVRLKAPCRFEVRLEERRPS